MKKKRSANSISKPVVSEIYKCVEAYETKDTKNRPFTVNKDDILDVIIKDHTGWWLVENEEKHLAWFPAPYLEKRIITEKDGAENDQSEDGKHCSIIWYRLMLLLTITLSPIVTHIGFLKCLLFCTFSILLQELHFYARIVICHFYSFFFSYAGMLYYTVKGYDAKSADELSFNIGVVVEVLQKSEDGWWLIHYNEKNGYVPSMYLQPYKNPHVKFQVLLCNELCVSTPNLYRPISSLDVNANVFKMGHGLDNQFHMNTLTLGHSTALQPGNREKSKSLSYVGIETDEDGLTMTSSELESRAGCISSDSADSLSLSWKSDSSGSSFKSSESETPPGHLLGVSSDHTADRFQGSQVSSAAGKKTADSGSGSDSDSSTYKKYYSPNLPRVPPRPNSNEILKRCTTITKKAVIRSKGNPAAVC
ncbi:uncharacterized protein LOC106701839 [Latimeria chalumnae]|uniref:uncharacterized protein LOC106701839 n=1 Tax=Latimeria chalumnae TaxID=7897 RepID=UPI00313CDF20